MHREEVSSEIVLPVCHPLSEHQQLAGIPHGSVAEGSLGPGGFHQSMNSETGVPCWTRGWGQRLGLGNE